MSYDIVCFLYILRILLKILNQELIGSGPIFKIIFAVTAFK